MHILSQEKSYPHTSPIVLDTERPLGRRQAVPLAGATLEPGQGPAGARGTGVVRATVARTGARLGQLSPPPALGPPIQTAAGCGKTSAHTAEGARWLWLPPHLRPSAKPVHSTTACHEVQPRAPSWPHAPTCLYLVSV